MAPNYNSKILKPPQCANTGAATYPRICKYFDR
nr:MAG TPA: hypothetical protein [Caudoviricetes sp.]